MSQGIAKNLPRTEYSYEVDTMRQNRVAVSFHKYGSAKINFGERLTDAIKSSQQAVDKYLATHNTEYLLDSMNYLMFEFMYPSIDDTYFKGTDGKGDECGYVGYVIKDHE